MTASFGDATLVHVANVAVPGIEITLLDTGYLFAETEWFADDFDPNVVDTVSLVEKVASLAKHWSRKPTGKRARRA